MPCINTRVVFWLYVPKFTNFSTFKYFIKGTIYISKRNTVIILDTVYLRKNGIFYIQCVLAFILNHSTIIASSRVQESTLPQIFLQVAFILEKTTENTHPPLQMETNPTKYHLHPVWSLCNRRKKAFHLIRYTPSPVDVITCLAILITKYRTVYRMPWTQIRVQCSIRSIGV